MSQFRRLFQSLGFHRIGRKLAILTGILLVPSVVLSYLLYASVESQVDFATSETKGVEYLMAARQSAGQAIEHRRLLTEFLLGRSDSRALLEKKQGELEASLRALQEMDKTHLPAGQTHTQKAWDVVWAEWQRVTNAIASARPGNLDKAAQVLAAYDKVIGGIREVMIEVSDASKLTLDPEYASYGLGTTALNLVADADQLGQVAWRGMVAVARAKATPFEEKATLLTIYGQLKASDEAIVSALEDIIEERKDIATAVEGKSKARDSVREDFLTCVDKDIVRAESPASTLDKVVEESSAAIAANLAMFDLAAPLLKKELTTRVSGFNRTLTTGFVAIVLGMGVALTVAILLTRGFTRQIRAYTELFAVVDRGDYGQRVTQVTEDELGEMSGSLNQVLATTDALIKRQKAEYDGLQSSIMKLLDDVSGPAQGDLTREAEVSADATGAIADAFNYTIEQLRKIISRVQTATAQVSNSATEIRSSAQHLAGGAENQAEQIVSVSAAIDEMATSIQQVSDNAVSSSTVAQQALQNAKQGNVAVRGTIEGMNRIREQAQETAKRIKRLGETSQEIGQIVQLIDDIADRTSILALNASIQAAAAGEAGRGFAVVAEEVERLAVRSTDATKKIASLVRAIQGETNEATAAMERSVQEVVSGSKVANQAGQSLAEIETVSMKLAELIQSISLAAKQQARGSEALARSMADINGITQNTAAGTKQTAESVDDLAKLADELRDSLGTFRLPAHMIAEATNGKSASGRKELAV